MTTDFASLTSEYTTSDARCTIGFQGLRHDEVTGNIYQRAREYSPRLGRFLQRDPLGYPDGMNTYAAYHVLYGALDPYGLESYWDLVHRALTGESPAQRKARERREAEEKERKRREREKQDDGITCKRNQLADLMIGDDLKKDTQQRAREIEEIENKVAGVAAGVEEAGRQIKNEAVVTAVTLPAGGPLGRLAGKGLQVGLKGGKYVLGRTVRRNGKEVFEEAAEKLSKAENEALEKFINEKCATRSRPWMGKPTNAQAAEEAAKHGWDKAKDPPFNSHGQAVFTDGKKFYTADADGHAGGTWKEFNRRGTRTGTLDQDLERIGD